MRPVEQPVALGIFEYRTNSFGNIMTTTWYHPTVLGEGMRLMLAGEGRMFGGKGEDATFPRILCSLKDLCAY